MPYSGIYRGVVVNATDPLNRGRLQVSVPAIGAATSTWAERSMPLGLTGSQPAAVNAGTRVWVMFEAGSADYPVVLGAMP